ncbi:MAG: hypothetical protein B6241_08430 [Spirochaetaceae bacterium 4572_59]|nr:MAG: hypothetical protein B6241_08430 [Spirochaetaceae bacterium 4572_59]
MHNFRVKALAGIFLICFMQTLFSLEWHIEPTDSSLLLPEGWSLHDDSEAGRLSFIKPDNTVIFQLTVYPGSTYQSDQEMMDSHLRDLEKIESDSSRFLYQGHMVSLSDSIFMSAGNQLRGWFLFIDRDDYDYYLTGICSLENYSESLPWILSCLDGFSVDDEGRKNPGVISSLLISGSNDSAAFPLGFEGQRISFRYNPVREEITQLMIEREASILSSYKDPAEFAVAWKRYYQMVYRDSGTDLDELAADIQDILKDKTNAEKAEILLSWLQEYEYGSSNSFSDLLAPVSVVLKQTGDCDALALVYCCLMNKMEIPALLMASYQYSHSMAAVSIDRKGAGFQFGERRYIVAEMTKKVDIGMINQDMADMNNWVVISLDNPEEKNIYIKE